VKNTENVQRKRKIYEQTLQKTDGHGHLGACKNQLA